MTRIVSFWLLVAIIVAVSLVFYQVMAGFLLPLFLATLLVVIFQPVHRRILRRCGPNRPLVAATLATGVVLACVFLPAAWIISSAASQSLALIRQIDLNNTLRQLQNVRVSLNLDVPQFEEAAELVPLFRDLATAAREQAAREQRESTAADGLARRFESAGERLETLFAGFPDQETDWPRPEIQPLQERLEKVRYALRAGAQAARKPIRPPITNTSAMANGTEENVAPLKDTVGRGPVEPPISEKPVSEKPVTQTPDSEESVTDASVLKANVTDQSDDEQPTPERASEDDGLSESPAVVRAAEEAEQAFAELRQSLPTGLPRLWLRQAANPSPAQLRQWRDNAQGAVQSWLLPAANATAGFVIQMIFGGLIMIVAVFFFFADGERMTVNVMRLIPLDIRHQQELLDDFAGITRAVVTATIVAAVAQGVLAGFGFWVSGVESVMFLVLLTIVLAMIPFVGAMSVWIPVCLWIGIVEGRIWTALLLATYSGVVVSQVDNIIKPMILQGRSNLHPLLALLSVLGGVKALGPIGILIGPMVVVFLQTLLKILHREMTNLESPARRSGTVPDNEPR
jgi:predicted PurR-regulated permease PerM